MKTSEDEVSATDAFDRQDNKVEGFQMRGDGLFRAGKGGEELRISSTFQVLGRVRTNEGRGWAKELQWTDEDGRVHTCTVPDTELHGEPNNLCRLLVEQGLDVVPGSGEPLARFLSKVKPTKRITLVERSGWSVIGGKRVFVLPGGTCCGATGETVSIKEAASTPFGIRGSLDDWKKDVAAIAAGNSRIVISIAAAFAGPLLELIGHEGGGFHFYGRSSTGKTTAVAAAASVWGCGDTRASSGQPFVRSWRSTANAVEATAAIHTDTLLVLDEIGVAQPQDVGAVAYQLAAGTGKGRAARDGSLRRSATWRTIALSTGEVRLEDKLREGKLTVTAGQAVRMLNIPADAGKGFGVFDLIPASSDAGAVANRLKAAARSTYGTAGPAFVDELLKHDLEGAPATVRLLAEKLIGQCATPPDGQVKRAALLFAVVGTAGELATDFGILPWSPGDIVRAVDNCWKAWLEMRGGPEAQEKIQAVERVRRFIEAHGTTRFDSLDAPDGNAARDRAGFRKGSGTDERWYVLPEAWKEICSPLNPQEVAKVLSDAGILEKATDGYQRVIKHRGKALRAYVLTSRILSSAEVSDE